MTSLFSISSISSVDDQKARKMRRTWQALATLLLALALLFVAGNGVAWAQDNAVLDLGKGVVNGTESVQSGEEFEYALSYSCSSISVPCENTVLVDTLPQCVELLQVVPTSHVESYDASGNTLTITFIDPLPGGSSGIIRVLVRFTPGTIPGDACVTPMPIINNATIDAANAAPKDATAPITLEEGDFDMFAQKNQLNEAVVGEPITFEVQLCSPPTPGGVPLTNPVFTDTLPPEAEFVSATLDPPDWVYDPVTNSVTWTDLPDPWPVGSCLTREITIIYNELPDPNVPQVNKLEVTGIPHGCEPGWTPQGSYCNPDDPTIVLTDTNIFELELPFGRWGVGKDAHSTSSFLGSEAIPGETINYTLAISNSGFLTITNVVITDTLPLPQPGHTEGPVVFDEMTFGPFTSTTPVSPTATITAYYKLRNDPALVPFPIPGPVYSSTVTVTLADLGLPPSSDIELFRWEASDSVLPGDGWSAEIQATVRISAETNLLITNCLDVSGTEIDTNTDPPTLRDRNSGDCANTEIIEARAIPRIDKERIGPGLISPLDETRFEFTVYNDSAANLDVVGPTALDLLPLEVIYVPGTFQIISTSAPTVPLPILPLEVIHDFNGTGRTMLRADWPEDALLPPGAGVTLGYDVIIKEGTPPGPLTNTVNLLTHTAPEVTLGCTDERFYQDTEDLDSDGDLVETGCLDQAFVDVDVQLNVDTQKYVRGQFEPVFSSFGRTPEGGFFDYKVVLTNTSNVPLTNIMLLDILPFVGDTGVIDLSPRGSEFETIPQFIISSHGAPLTVWYSSAKDPCRGDMLPAKSPPNCETPNWSLTAPTDANGNPDPTQIQSVRVNVCSSGTAEDPQDCFSLPRNDAIEITWRMVLPPGQTGSAECLSDPVGPNCPVAWNSFAFTAEGGGMPFRPSEPPKVGIAITPHVDATIGDHVWFDVQDTPNNGIQGPTEQGINNVRVLLLNAAMTEVLDVSITGNDSLGRPGYYRFLIVEPEALRYRIAFEVPKNFQTSPPLQGSNPLSDSNGITITTVLTLPQQYIITDAFTVTGAITEDLGFDQGLWTPLDFGDAPQGTIGSLTFNYPTRYTGSSDLTLAARHTVADVVGQTMKLGARVDDEVDGQPNFNASGDDSNGGIFFTNPSPDDEDGIRFPFTIQTLNGPVGILTRGSSQDLAISATVQITVPGIIPYLQGWVDFDHSWDWSATGTERIITNRVITNGVQSVSIVVPADAELGITYARFRVGSSQDFGPGGTVLYGEVEDYPVLIMGRPVKQLVASSEAHTPASGDPLGNLTSVAIGEIVRYRLTAQLPRGSLGSLVITDSIPTGLMYLGNPTFAVTAAIPSLITGNILTPTITPASFASGTDVIFDFGAITNNNEGPGAEFVVIEFNALVLNDAANQDNVAASSRRNTFTVAYDDEVLTSNPIDVLILEPLLTQAKTRIVSSPIDAGNIVTWTLTTSAASGARRTTAFDTTISDTVDSTLALVPGSLVVTTTPGGIPFVDNSSGNLISITVPTLAPGQSVVVTYRTTINQSVRPGQTIPNTVRTRWTSLPGPNGTTTNPTGQATPGASGLFNGERNGETAPPTLNNYLATASASLVVGNPGFVKLQQPNPWTIGQPISFTLVITAIEGTTPGVRITDTLPAGLLFTGYDLITTAADSNGLLEADFAWTGGLPAIISPPGSTPVALNVGDIDNPGDNITNNDRFLIVINAVVRNVLSNQHGVTMQNSAAMGYSDAANVRRVIGPPPVDINLVEPTLQIEKSVDYDQPADAGDVVTYTVVVRHAPTSTITAHDVLITDTVPSALENVTYLDTQYSGSGTIVGAVSGNVLRVPDSGTFDLLPGEVVTVTYRAELPDLIALGTTITNTAGAIWATLEDTFPLRRDDGLGTPDQLNLLDSGALDDYEVNASAVVHTEAVPDILKVQPPNPWTIGQHLTFTLIVTMPEGLVQDVSVLDILPPGLGFVSQRVITTSAESGGLLAQDFPGFFQNPPTVTPAPQSPAETATITWNFGNVINPGLNNPNNNRFLIQVEAVVLNILPNQHGVSMENNAELHYSVVGRLLGIITPPPVIVELVEPELVITKESTYTSPASAGDIVTFTVTLRHVPTSTITAYGVILTDTVPSALTDVNVVDLTYTGGALTHALSGNYIRVPADPGSFDMAPGDALTMTVTARITDADTPGQVITNTAGAIWASLPPGNEERRTDGEGMPDGQNLIDSDALDNYEVNASAQVTLDAQPTFAKLPVENPWTIGEHITFTLVVTTVEGTLPNVVITDALPEGLGFLSQRVLLGNFNGTFVNDPPIVSPAPLPEASAESATVTWNFGTIVNPADVDSTNETFQIELVAVVLNLIGNQDGVTMQNSAAMAYTDGTGVRQTLSGGPVDVELIEPVLAISKTVTYVDPLDAGDLLTYTITLRHVPTSTIPAYDTLITDTLAAELSNVVLKDVQKNGVPILGAIGAQGIRVPDVGTVTLYPTETITVVYTAVLDDDAEAGVVFTNTVGAIWSSLPNTFPQRRDDGVGNPDRLNLLDSGALDDYEVNATAAVTPSVEYTITKGLVATSAAHTPGADLTIGEVVTYSLRVTVSEGRIVRPVVTDTLPAGLAWTGTWDADLSAFVGTISEPTVSGQIGVSGAPVVFAAGEQIISGDNLTTTNTLTLYLSAIVVDIPLNVGLPGNQTQLDNYATMTANNLPPVDSNVVTIQIVEPRMEITKVITPSVSPPQGVVTVTLVVSNTGLSTAFETRMEDLLPAGLAYFGGASEVSGNGASPAVIITAPSLVAASWLTFPVGTQSVIQFFAQLDAGLPTDMIITNTATVTNATTLPGDDPNERTEPPADASDDVRVINHDLVLVKTVDSATYRAGEIITWTITITNVGEAVAPGVVITDIVPLYTTYDASVNPLWFNSVTFPTPCQTGEPAGTQCMHIVGDLEPGESRTVLFGVRAIEPLPNPAPTIENAACVSDDGTLGEDPTPANNCDDDQTDFVLAQLGDRVWLDRNGNGIQEAGEIGYQGMTINLHRVGTLLPISTTTSNLTGHYYFTNLDPGDYFVEFVPMADPLITLQHEGLNPLVDSDADRTTGRTQEVTLSASEINNSIDAGVYYLSVIGDRVWNDLNANGVQDSGETGIPNVTVSLLVQGSVILTTTTNPNGYYFFTDLDFGVYSVRVDAVPGFLVSPKQMSGNDATDSDIDPITRETRTISIEQSLVYLNFDAGFYSTSALGDYVWEDMNANGIQEAGEPAIPLVAVQLLQGGSVISSTLTNASGLYLFDGLDLGDYVIRFTPLPGHRATLQGVGSDRTVDSDIDPTTHETAPIAITVPITDMTWDAGFYRPVTIGDFVWHDNNANGLQEAGEPGLAEVAVSLLYTDGTPVATAGANVNAAATIRTNPQGFYLFTDIAPGSYMVEVGRPTAMVHSQARQGGDRTIDSDIDPATHRSNIITLQSNGEDLTIDAGFFITGALGSYVWMDINVDGIRDPEEPPVAGVTVQLLQSGRSTTLATTATDADGLFLFDHLPPGRYQLQFTAPTGLAFTWRDTINDPMRNSDVNPGTGLTDPFDLDEGINDLTWGAGLITPTNDPDTPEPDGGTIFWLWLPSIQQ